MTGDLIRLGISVGGFVALFLTNWRVGLCLVTIFLPWAFRRPVSAPQDTQERGGDTGT